MINYCDKCGREIIEGIFGGKGGIIRILIFLPPDIQ